MLSIGKNLRKCEVDIKIPQVPVQLKKWEKTHGEEWCSYWVSWRGTKGNPHDLRKQYQEPTERFSPSDNESSQRQPNHCCTWLGCLGKSTRQNSARPEPTLPAHGNRAEGVISQLEPGDFFSRPGFPYTSQWFIRSNQLQYGTELQFLTREKGYYVTPIGYARSAHRQTTSTTRNGYSTLSRSKPQIKYQSRNCGKLWSIWW